MSGDPADASPPQLPDYLRPGLRLVFVGFNPSVYAALKGHYYARPSNRFYLLLHEAGFTPHRFKPEEDHRLPDLGIGLTDIVKRPTPMAADLSRADFEAGRVALREKLLRYRPAWVGLNGKGVAENLLVHPVDYGRQDETLDGISLFVLPNTSGAAAGMLLRDKLVWWSELATLAGFRERAKPA